MSREYDIWCRDNGSPTMEAIARERLETDKDISITEANIENTTEHLLRVDPERNIPEIDNAQNLPTWTRFLALRGDAKCAMLKQSYIVNRSCGYIFSLIDDGLLSWKRDIDGRFYITQSAEITGNTMNKKLARTILEIQARAVIAAKCGADIIRSESFKERGHNDPVYWQVIKVLALDMASEADKNIEKYLSSFRGNAPDDLIRGAHALMFGGSEKP